MKCGVCGGGVRGFSGVLHGRPIRDWKHTDVPDDWRNRPHRPVLGTPVDQATLDRIHRTPAPEPVRAEPPPPKALPREATDAELASSQSATQILRMMESEGWVPPGVPTYLQTADGSEYIVIKAQRRDLGVVAVWRRRPDKPWAFDEAWRLSKNGIHQVTSTSLKTWLTQRDEECPDCGTSSAAHGEECAA